MSDKLDDGSFLRYENNVSVEIVHVESDRLSKNPSRGGLMTNDWNSIKERTTFNFKFLSSSFHFNLPEEISFISTYPLNLCIHNS